MSTNLQFRLTSAGQAAAWNASNTGIALELTHVQFGSGNRAPTGTETALVTPRAYVAIAAGNRVAPNQIRLSAMLTGPSSFNIAEIGIWKGVPGQPGSVLFAYWSQSSGVLGAKAPGVDFIFTHDMVLSDAVAAGSVTVVADTNQSAMLALMAEHEAKPDPHVGYLLESALELTAVPTQKIAPIICVTQPYFRIMVWDGSQYVRPPIYSPNLTGVPTAPTAAPGTNTKQIANTEFVQAIFASIVTVAPGTTFFTSGSSAPARSLKANGAAVSRTAYAALFEAIGTMYGSGDGSTTFNLPDLRGEFLRCLDDGRGVDAGRTLNSFQGDAIRNIAGKIGNLALERNTSSGAFYSDGTVSSQWHGPAYTPRTSMFMDASRVVPTANENRPRNIALLTCIAY